MIPTLIVAGLVFGRWRRAAPVVAAAGWALLLTVEGIIPPAAGPLAAAAGLAAVNTAAGVAVVGPLTVHAAWTGRDRTRPTSPSRHSDTSIRQGSTEHYRTGAGDLGGPTWAGRR